MANSRTENVGIAAPGRVTLTVEFDKILIGLLRSAPLLVTIATIIFLFVPLLVLIIYSFNASRSISVWQGFTLDWYISVFNDRRLGRALLTSTVIAVVSGLVSTVIGTLTALVIARRKFSGKEALSTALLAPVVLPEIVIAVAFLVMMVMLKIPLGFFTLIVGHVVVTLPFAVLVVRAAASALDPRLEEAASDLGANEWQTMTRVTLPVLKPAIFTAFLLAVTLSFDNFVMSTFVTGVGSTTLPIYIYAQLRQGLSPQINAIGALLILANVTVVLIVLSRVFGRKIGRGKFARG